MWNKSALMLMVRVELPNRRCLKIPVSVWVVDEFLEALTDLAWLGEMVLRCVPIPSEKSGSYRYVRRIKAVSAKGIIAGVHNMIKDLRKYRGLDVVDVETGDVKVKISLR